MGATFQGNMRYTASIVITVITVTVVAVVLAARFSGRQTEHFAANTGADWLHASWMLLTTPECVEFSVSVGANGAVEGPLVYFPAPSAMTICIEAFGTPGAFLPAGASGQSAGSIELDPTSTYYESLSGMDAMASRYAADLAKIQPWYLPAGLTPPPTFSALTSSFLTSTSTSPTGSVVWNVDPAVAAAPAQYSAALVAFLSFAKLLRDLAVAHSDYDEIDQTRKLAEAATIAAADAGIAKLTAPTQAAQTQLAAS